MGDQSDIKQKQTNWKQTNWKQTSPTDGQKTNLLKFLLFLGRRKERSCCWR